MTEHSVASRAEASAEKTRPQVAGWYAGLDGVRAVAVFLVFTVHFMARQTLAVGWTGVLIFFVLSGFLITGILFDNQREKHRFLNFYARRTLRIFPLFYFVWLLVLVADPIFHLAWRPAQTLWLFYLGNYARFIAGTTAVDHVFTANPMVHLEIGHFWSLAVEEQFYLIWPLVVFYARERGKLIRICLWTVFGVLALRVALVWTLPQPLLDHEFLYRMTFSQCDAFLLGGALALWMRGPEKALLLRHAEKVFGVALALLLAAWLANSGWRPSPLYSTTRWMSTYGYTLVDLASAGLILCSLKQGTVVFRVMTTLPARVLGKYSYGFYVYHVLLAPFLQMAFPPADPFHHKLIFYAQLLMQWTVSFVVILGVSAASYRLIEAPFLRLKSRFPTQHRNPASREQLRLRVDRDALVQPADGL